ncbi:squalene-hopene cyclase-like protein [Scopulibacillus darangshiensis]|uniref:Squalene-hopene cyclase-like protein n=1 Tax=Scopulibacillus darangshiensis TaxID=442528 RepID=A0A4R2N966_9BACL|nr:hypothetical protein [Scopulibacillus darangshiensis]TCP17445.1 squalene-hopene cyclase-like protein [Scopulibacillus darangshiensis]
MISPTEIDPIIQGLIHDIKEKQSEDGAFRYCFESGPMTDANMIIILRVLDYNDEDLIKKLVHRLLSTQQSNGAWKLYDDTTGHLSATVEAYTALLFSGYANRSDGNMKKAESFILDHGGLKNTHVSTKFMLALNGLYPWPNIFPFPLFIIHSPSIFPFSFYKFSTYVRAHFAPVLILGHKRFITKNRWTPDLSHLLPRKRKNVKKWRKLLSTLFSKKFFAKSACRKAESQMLKGVGDDGILFTQTSHLNKLVYP